MVTSLAKLLSVRPGNAAARFGSNAALPVLSWPQVARALEGRTVLAVPVPVTAALGGVLRAARDQDAVVVVACPYVPMDRDAAASFTQALAAAAREAAHHKPLVLQAGPIRLAPDLPLERYETDVHRFIEAGFTLLSLDASRLPADQMLEAYRRLSEPARERELAFELVAPRWPEGRTSVEMLEALLSGLKLTGAPPALVRVPASAVTQVGGTEHFPDEAHVYELTEVAAAFAAELTLEEHARLSLREVGRWVELGVRKLELGAALCDVALRALGPAESEALRSRAGALRLPTSDLLALFAQRVADGEPADLERIEALSYGCVDGLIEATRGRRSGAAVRAALGAGE